MYRKLSAPAAVQWEVTPSCNHLCVWCYNFWREGDPLPSLPDDYEVRYSKVVDELIRMRVFSVIITGGEPMMVIERVAPFIKRLSDAGIHIYLNSNLTLLSPERAQLIKDAGVRSILVSLPSADPETCDRLTNSRNAVDRTTRGIKIALEFGFPVMVNMVVSRDNLHQVRMTAEYVASLGVKRFAATRASNPWREVALLIEYSTLMSFGRCCPCWTRWQSSLVSELTRLRPIRHVPLVESILISLIDIAVRVGILVPLDLMGSFAHAIDCQCHMAISWMVSMLLGRQWIIVGRMNGFLMSALLVH